MMINETMFKEDNAPFTIKESKKIAILSDIHFPYHDEQALSIALLQAKKEDVDTIILNGDIVDFYSISSYDKDPRRRFLKEEKELAIQHLTEIRELFPDAKIYYHEGNHEERLYRYLIRNAKEIADLEELQIENLLKLNQLNITYIGNRTMIKLGKLDILHGHEIKTYASINIANSILRKTFHNTLTGHFHQRQNFTKKTTNDEVIGVWVTGCLCYLYPYYNRINDWNHGFAIVELEKNGNFLVKNFIIYRNNLFL